MFEILHLSALISSSASPAGERVKGNALVRQLGARVMIVLLRALSRSVTPNCIRRRRTFIKGGIADESHHDSCPIVLRLAAFVCYMHVLLCPCLPLCGNELHRLALAVCLRYEFKKRFIKCICSVSLSILKRVSCQYRLRIASFPATTNAVPLSLFCGTVNMLLRTRNSAPGVIGGTWDVE